MSDLALPPTTATLVYKSIRASGGDYTSIYDLESAKADLVTAGEAWVVDCYGDIEETVGITWGGWNTDADHYLYIRSVKVTDGADGSPSRGHQMACAVQCLGMGDIGTNGRVYFEGIYFESNNVTSAIGWGSTGNNSALVTFINCTIISTRDGAMGVYWSSASNRNLARFVNCLIIADSHAIHSSVLGSHACDIIGCTLISWRQHGWYNTNAGGWTVKNSFFRGKVADVRYTSGHTFEGCFSPNALGGSGSTAAMDTSTFVSCQTDAYDFHLVTGSPLINAGVSVSGQTEVYAVDFEKGDRNVTTPDVGADEFGEVGPDYYAGGGADFFYPLFVLS